MEKPVALKVISIIVIVFGVLRIFLGIMAIPSIIQLFSMGNIEYVSAFLLDDFLGGVLLLTAWILLINGKKAGRILLIAAMICIIGTAVILTKKYCFNRVHTGLMVSIILLYFFPSVKTYFDK